MSESAEVRLAEILKQQCFRNGKEKEPKKSAETLHKLGILCRNKSPDKQSLIQSVGLMTSAVIREPDNSEEIRKDLEDVCSHILELAGARKQHQPLQSFVVQLKDQVKRVREACAEKLKAVEKIPDDVDGNLLTEMQIKKIDWFKSIQQYITDSYTDVMKRISVHCVGLLGKPPCKFAVAGMGSLARKEVTPYSDFESIILLEDGVRNSTELEYCLNYFRWFTVIFQMILVRLGETVLRFLAISCLNNPLDSEKNWFYDAYTPCGICPDGFAPAACKNPLGRQTLTSKKPWTTELIKPVSDMVKYLDSEEDLKNGYHLADILMQTCFVFGDEAVFDNFVSAVNKRKLSMDLTDESQNQSFLTQLKDDFCSFSYEHNETNYLCSDKLDVKRMFYRSCSLFVSALGHWFGIEAVSSLDILDKLRFENFISMQDYHKLKFAVTIICEVRLRFYIRHDSQTDQYLQHHRVFQPRESHHIAESVGTKSFLQVLASIMTFQRSFMDFVRGRTFREPFKLYPEDVLGYIKLSLHLTLPDKTLQFCLKYVPHQLQLTLVDRRRLFLCYVAALHHCQKYEEAIRVIKINLPKARNAKLTDVLESSYRLLGDSLFDMGNTRTALKFFRKANFYSFFHLAADIPGNWKAHWADSYGEMERFPKQLRIINRLLSELQECKDKWNDERYCSATFAKGVCLFNQGLIQEAKTTLENLIEKRSSSILYKEGEDYWTNKCNYILSLCLVEHEEFGKALQLYETTRENDPCKNEPIINAEAKYLLCKATCLLGLNNISEAYKCFKQLEEYLSCKFIKGNKKRFIFPCLNYLGSCAELLRKYEESLAYYQQLLSFFDSLKDRKCLHVAATKAKIARLQLMMGNDDKVFPFSCNKTLSKRTRNREDLYMLYQYNVILAKCHLEGDKYLEAINPYRDAVEILKKIPRTELLTKVRKFKSDKMKSDLALCLLRANFPKEALFHSREALRESSLLDWTAESAKRKMVAIHFSAESLSCVNHYDESIQALKYGLQITQELFVHPHLEDDFFLMAELWGLMHIRLDREKELNIYGYTPSVYYFPISSAHCNARQEIFQHFRE